MMTIGDKVVIITDLMIDKIDHDDDEDHVD